MRKKSFLAGLVFCLALLLAGCGAQSTQTADVEPLEEEPTQETTAERIETEDYDILDEDNKYAEVDGIALNIPNNWSCSSDKDGIVIVPEEESPFAFYIRKADFIDETESSFRDDDIQKNIADTVVSKISPEFDFLELSDYGVTQAFANDTEHFFRDAISIDVSFSKQDRSGHGDISILPIGKELYIYSLFQFNDSKYDFSTDYLFVGKTIWSASDFPKDLIGKSGKSESIDDSDDGSDIGNDDSQALYEKYISDLKAAGVVTSVDDSMGSVDGLWIFYVNSNWNHLSQTEKQALADDILSNIKPWAEGMYNLTPTIAIENESGAIVAQTNSNSTKMKLK